MRTETVINYIPEIGDKVIFNGLKGKILDILDNNCKYDQFCDIELEDGQLEGTLIQNLVWSKYDERWEVRY